MVRRVIREASDSNSRARTTAGTNISTASPVNGDEINPLHRPENTRPANGDDLDSLNPGDAVLVLEPLLAGQCVVCSPPPINPSDVVLVLVLRHRGSGSRGRLH